MLHRLTLVAATGLGVLVSAGFQPASAAPLSSLSANWFTIGFGHADTGKSIDGLTTGLVENTLGPNGRPVRSAASLGFPVTSSNNIVDVNASNEILWWTVGARAAGTVSPDAFYPTTVGLPFSVPSNLFPGGAGSNGDPNGYVAAHFFGEFTAPSSGSITFTLGADDDAWVFVNGELVVDLGGVKALTPAPTTVTGLAPGNYRIDLFFADRHVVQSGLTFSADVAFRPPPSPVPAPASLMLFGIALSGLGLLRLRRV